MRDNGGVRGDRSRIVKDNDGERVDRSQNVRDNGLINRYTIP